MSLYLLEARPFETSTVLFLHGLGLSSSMWFPQLERLVDYHCLAPDLPESGNSVQIGPFTLADSSRRIADLIREYAPHGSVHVVGMWRRCLYSNCTFHKRIAARCYETCTESRQRHLSTSARRWRMLICHGRRRFPPWWYLDSRIPSSSGARPMK